MLWNNSEFVFAYLKTPNSSAYIATSSAAAVVTPKFSLIKEDVSITDRAFSGLTPSVEYHPKIYCIVG
jgi:hypothetical protein